MGRAAQAISGFFRLAFWPLAVSVLVVFLLQPIYFLSLASLGHLTSRDRTVQHLSAAFDSGVLADDGAPRSLLFKGGEQLTECISLGIEPRSSRDAGANRHHQRLSDVRQHARLRWPAPCRLRRAVALAILLSAAVVSMQRRPNLGELWAQLQILRAKLPRLRPKRADHPEA